MKKTVIGFFCIMMTSFAFSQGTVIGISSGHGFKINPEELPVKAAGSMYYSESFLPATITGETESLLFRYNAHRDEMEYEDKGELFYLIKSDDVEVNFKHSKKTYKYLSYIDGSNDVRGYLVKLVENEKNSLYKKEYISYIPAKEATNGYDKTRPAEYKKVSDTYFIKVGDSQIKNFPKNKKELLKTFPDKSDKINEYLKKNKISFSNELDLINLVTFINTL